MVIEASVEIDRPPEHVFAWVSEPDLAAQWVPNVVAAKAHGELRLGAETHTLIEFAGQRVDATGRVTGYSPPWRFEETVEYLDIRSVQEATLERLEGNRTHLTLRIQVEVPSRGPRFVSRLFGGVERRRLGRALAKLKRLVEDAAPPPTSDDVWTYD